MGQKFEQQFDTGASFTITLDSLTNNSSRQSTVVDNSTSLYDDVLVLLKIVAGGSSTSATGVVAVYAFGTVDAGTSYSENAGATDAAITLTSPPNMVLIGIVNVVANSTTYFSRAMSLASAFGGTVPQKFGIVVTNLTGGTLGTGNTAKYQGVWGQSTP